MTTRRQWLLTAALGCGSQALHLAYGEQPRDAWERAAAELITPAAEQAIEKGLAYLRQKQGEDGAFAGSGYARNVAVCSLAGLSFMATGSTPRRGPYAKEVQRSLAYVLSSSDENGFLSLAEATSQGPMYDHGFATMFLAEVYGTTDDSRLRERLSKAVQLIVSTQNMEGGWRYQPRIGDADISVTICQVMALRAARNAGIAVPGETIERSVNYIKRCQNADGGFMYMHDASPSKFPRSAAGLAALYSAGYYDEEELKKGLNYLRQFLPRNEDICRDTHSMYGQYYAVQVMWQAGGEHWQRWYPAIREALIATQQPNGAWNDPICPEYGAAVACLILQMPNNFLPIFQR